MTRARSRAASARAATPTRPHRAPWSSSARPRDRASRESSTLGAAASTSVRAHACRVSCSPQHRGVTNLCGVPRRRLRRHTVRGQRQLAVRPDVPVVPWRGARGLRRAEGALLPGLYQTSGRTLPDVRDGLVQRDRRPRRRHRRVRDEGVLLQLQPVRRQPSEKDAKLAQKLGQLQPFIAIFSLECMGQLGYFGAT